MTDTFKSGFIALIGRPNVGKSALLNALLDQKIAIVADRQQTTRNRLLGIKTFEHAQMIFVDTSGIHSPRHALGESMVRTAEEAMQDIDVIAFVGGSAMSIIPPPIQRSPLLRKLFSIPDTNVVVGSMILGYPKYRYQRGIKRNLKRVTWI